MIDPCVLSKHHFHKAAHFSMDRGIEIQTPNMAPSSPAPASSSNWEPSTVIELLALTLTVPGAISALVTLYIVVSRRQKKKRQTQQGQEQGNMVSTQPCIFVD
jgi:hypothetical protein